MDDARPQFSIVHHLPEVLFLRVVINVLKSVKSAGAAFLME